MIRVPYKEVLDVLCRVLVKLEFTLERAQLCAQLFADTSRDGVYSHGLDRFPRFVRAIRKGIVDIHATPQLMSDHGSLERWNGNRGPGNLNAWQSMARAIALSHRHGIGCVALANTNHWMRGGTYGWQAAEAGVIGICWTNTMPNLPPWGASTPKVGNNPLIIAVPRPKGMWYWIWRCHNSLMARWHRTAHGVKVCRLMVASILKEGSLAIRGPLKPLADRCQSAIGRGRDWR